MCVACSYSSLVVKIGLLVIGFLWIPYFFRYMYRQMRTHSTRITMDQLYHYLKHGDIVNSNNMIDRSFIDVFSYYNTGLCHCMMIIEENGIKYVLHAHSNNYPLYKKNIIKSSIPCIFSPGWHIIKEPLLEFLHTSEHSLYHIYRPPSSKKPIRIKNISFSHKRLLGKPFYYCTLLHAELLVKHGHIPPSSRYYPYRIDELVQALQENGYQFVSVHY